MARTRGVHSAPLLLGVCGDAVGGPVPPHAKRPWQCCSSWGVRGRGDVRGRGWSFCVTRARSGRVGGVTLKVVKQRILRYRCSPRGTGCTVTARDALDRGGSPPPPSSRAPSPCPASVPLTATASLNGICNRQ